MYLVIGEYSYGSPDLNSFMLPLDDQSILQSGNVGCLHAAHCQVRCCVSIEAAVSGMPKQLSSSCALLKVEAPCEVAYPGRYVNAPWGSCDQRGLRAGC